MGVIVWVVVALAALVMVVGWCVMRAADDGDDEPPCKPGGYCERYARGLGGCVAGHCNRPAPRL